MSVQQELITAVRTQTVQIRKGGLHALATLVTLVMESTAVSHFYSVYHVKKQLATLLILFFLFSRLKIVKMVV